MNDFPISEKAERQLIPCAFEKDALRVYEDVARTYINASAETLWSRLENRLCNKAHCAALQDTFFALRWNERHESVATYADRLKLASMTLATLVSDEVLLNRFKAGLPQKLQDQAVLVTGAFDSVVSVVSRLSSAQQNTAQEHVGEIAEPAKQASVHSVAVRTPDERFGHVKCHYCQRMGHIVRYCDKRRADMARGNAVRGAGKRMRV